MAVIRIYDVTTTSSPLLIQAGFTISGVNQGGFCHIGGPSFACCDASGVYLIHVDHDSAEKTRTLVTLTGHTGTGNAIDVEYNRAGKLLVTLRKDEGSPVTRKLKLRQYDIETGALDWEYDWGASSNEGGICFNGQHWFMSWETTQVTNPHRLYILSINGKTVTVDRNYPLANADPASNYYENMMWDGIHLWTRVGSFIARWEMLSRVPPHLQASWVASGVRSRGMAYDGLHLFIISQT